IPTGSMAETLLGYNKVVVCPDCGHEFPVNCSNEVDPSDGGPKRPLIGAVCPNCRYPFPMSKAGNPTPQSGDRVLVHMALFHVPAPERGQVVVFKCPVDTQYNHTAQNYIKRLWGLGGETIAIYRGDLYLCRDLDYPEEMRDEQGRLLFPRPDDRSRLW